MEEKYGHWQNRNVIKPRAFERTGDTFSEMQCSCCKRWSVKITYHIELKYCPNCGARMDGGSEK